MFVQPKKFIWRSYPASEALFITNQVEFIDKKICAKVILYKNSEIFVIYMSALEVTECVNFSNITKIGVLQ